MNDALLAHLTYRSEDAGTLAPIAWPEGLAPTPAESVPLGHSALPVADVLVVTWTAAEWQALADVLTPGKRTTSWLRYTENWDQFERHLTWKSPAKESKCAAFRSRFSPAIGATDQISRPGRRGLLRW